MFFTKKKLGNGGDFSPRIFMYAFLNLRHFYQRTTHSCSSLVPHMHKGLSPPCLSHERSLVLHSSWSGSLWADREMLLKGGHNPQISERLYTWPDATEKKSVPQTISYRASELTRSASKTLSTLSCCFLSPPNAVAQILGRIITNNKNALDPCLTPLWRLPHSAPLCSRLDTVRLLKGTDITLSHSSRRFDARHWCATALATSLAKGTVFITATDSWLGEWSEYQRRGCQE